MKKVLTISLFLICFYTNAQKDTTKYDREEEIISDRKRYRLHNNYLMAGFGYSYSSIRSHKEQSTLGIDYVFHIRRHHFQVGVLMSGDQFLENNNLQGHIGYVYRIENEKCNIAFGLGLTRDKGEVPPIARVTDTLPAFFYRNTGIYANVSYIKKLTYDIGIGIEGIFEINKAQTFAGIKGIVFFSGGYRGKAKVHNIHVKPKRK